MMQKLVALAIAALREGTKMFGGILFPGSREGGQLDAVQVHESESCVCCYCPS